MTESGVYYVLVNDRGEYGKVRIGDKSSPVIAWLSCSDESMRFGTQAEAEAWLVADPDARVAVVLATTCRESPLLQKARRALHEASFCNGPANHHAEFRGDGLCYIRTRCGAIGLVRQIPSAVQSMAGLSFDGIDLTPHNVVRAGVAVADVVAAASCWVDQ